MTPTTLRTVHADFVTTIRGIVPDYDLYQDSEWVYVPERDQVPGEKLRLFHLEWDFPEPVETGIYGDAIEHEVGLNVWVNYRSLTDERLPECVAADGRQLWIELEDRLDPTLAGLVFVKPSGPFVLEHDEERNSWGYFPFTVTILLSHAA